MANINFGEFDLSDPTGESTVQYAGTPPSQEEIQQAAAESDAGGGSYTSPPPSFRESENASMDAQYDRSPSFRQSENASMDTYNAEQQGPPVPTPASSGSRDSNNADTTGTTGGNAGGTKPESGEGQAGSGSSYGSSSNSGESPVGNTGYTNSNGAMSRIIAGLQNSGNNTNLSSDGYNPSKYSMARKNPLNAFVSFNCLYTLACMSKQQQNTVRKYSKNMLQNIVCRTAGDWDKPNSHVSTDFGQYDYIIDDLIIASLPAMSGQAGATFANQISFKVTEPYSLGLFFLALQEGARKGGYGNFKEACYMLMIEFLGYRDDGKPFIDDNLTRFIPMFFSSIKLKAGQAGSIYECTGNPYNEVAFRSPYVNLDKEQRLEGADVKSVLSGGGKSLKAALKEMTDNMKKNGIADATDEYEIHFPKDFTTIGDTGNEISKSPIFTNFDDAGQPKFPDGNAVFDKVKQLYKNSPINLTKDKNFHFVQNSKITDIITEVVLRSDFIVKQLLNDAILTNPLGMIKWFRIETRIEDMKESKTFNRQVRKLIYRVVPYDVSISRLVPGNSQPQGYKQIEQTLTRVYEYLYTGQNTDILRLDLEFNMAYYAALPSDATDRTGTNTSALVPNANKDSNENYKPPSGFRSEAAADAIMSSAISSARDTQVNPAGGSGSDSDKSMQAKTLQALLTQDGDLTNLEIEVRGDPYYLPSSGMGNQIGQPANFNVMTDGSMNYQSGETDFAIVLRTPVDLDPKTGLYRFAKTVDELSGLYMITAVESKFNHNKFTQVIKGIRRRVQLGTSAAGSKNILFG
jgi:hypothetical protein